MARVDTTWLHDFTLAAIRHHTLTDAMKHDLDQHVSTASEAAQVIAGILASAGSIHRQHQLIVARAEGRQVSSEAFFGLEAMTPDGETIAQETLNEAPLYVAGQILIAYANLDSETAGIMVAAAARTRTPDFLVALIFVSVQMLHDITCHGSSLLHPRLS